MVGPSHLYYHALKPSEWQMSPMWEELPSHRVAPRGELAHVIGGKGRSEFHRKREARITG